MKHISLLKEFEQLDTLFKNHKFKDALKLVEDLISQYPHSVELLVKYAKIIQLIDEKDLSKIPPLDVALESLKKAHMLAPRSIEPCLELGYFEYAVNDRPDEAVKYFEVAEEIAIEGLKDALMGLIKCNVEIGNMSHAKEILREAKAIFPDDIDIDILELELFD